ncbi:DUF4153 domain-containing protein [Qipengyuania sphaerica]|uniref:DUF4153 domain-containing protein n=1 Tax=Qipengyuania sphaerica TaxID=2867243 RepID=UPI001C870CD2|nr:DUF4153 domain-containing protein [Qipengyuania sphaerica]MBX7539938.1 DUF4153 domain-containing protein [Qipengyuania sphaerica]
MTDNESTHISDWSMRPWVLAAMLGIAGLLVWYLTDVPQREFTPWRAALGAFVFFGAGGFALTVDRANWKRPLAFSLLIGAIMAGIAWRVAGADDHYSDAGYWMAAGVVSIVLAIPLFQSGFHRLRWATPYKETHFHVWTDAISVAGALAFFALSWLLANLLAELFAAIEIDLLRELLRDDWFNASFAGVTIGAALGVLRNQLKVIGTLQSVVMLVFSLIAVPFAATLVIFILAVLVSGLDVLWGATRSPTPLLLSCAAASFVLVNSVVRNGDEEASGNRVMRWAALVLALGILPLAIMAAISTGTRIAEYGLSPERIWGLVAIVVAVAYGVAYFVAPIRGRMAHWMDRVRTANLHLAVGTCVLTFLLALPILDFGAISTRDQLDRLASGKVETDEFDFSALRWDFGDAGRAALDRLAKSDDEQIAEMAASAAAQNTRTYRRVEGRSQRDERMDHLRIAFRDESLRQRVEQRIRDTSWLCNMPCVALDAGDQDNDRRMVAIVENGHVQWLDFDLANPDAASVGAVDIEESEFVRNPIPPQHPGSSVEIREWHGRRIYVDGKPAGQPFE